MRSPDVPSPDTAPAPHSSLVLLNAGFRAIADIGSKLATAVLYLLVARKVGASQFGVFTFAIAFAGIAVTLGQFGQEVVLIREVVRDHEQLDRYYSDALSSKLILSIPPLLGAVVVAALAGMNSRTLAVVLLMGLGFIGDYLISVSFAVFQAYERLTLLPVVLITQRWVTTAFATTALFLGMGIVTVAAIYAVGAVMAASLAAALLFRTVGRPRLRFDLRGALQITRTATPVGLGLVALLVLARIDTSMLAIFSSSREVGQYSAAYRLLETTAFVTWAVNTAVLPRMSRLSPTSDPPLGLIYARALKLVLALTIPACVGAAILAVPIIDLLYGTEFHRAAKALLLLSPTIMLFPVSSLSSQLFYSQDVRRIVARTYAAVLVENIIWNLILIPRYSLYGAAAGTAVSELLVAGTLLFYSRPLHGRLDVPRVLMGPVAASALAAVVMAVFSSTLVLAIPLGVLVYLSALFAIERMAFPEDFAVAVRFVRHRRAGAGLPADG